MFDVFYEYHKLRRSNYSYLHLHQLTRQYIVPSHRLFVRRWTNIPKGKYILTPGSFGSIIIIGNESILPRMYMKLRAIKLQGIDIK